MYLTPKQVQEKFGYHPKTLSRWADEGLIEYTKSPGGHRRYLLSSLEKVAKTSEDRREVILYVRVSTHSQKEDLKSQREYVSSYYPQCKCISDIGSGLNFKRKKFLKLMEQVANHEVKKIVVAHKDRLCRFGFDFVEWFCNLNGCQIEVLNHSYKSPHQELMDDFMAVMHCFSSKLYFLRSYEKKIQEDMDKSEKA
jgi:putative resolvase